MSTIETNALSVLRGLRALVGEVAFNAAVEAVRSDKDLPAGAAVTAVPEKKKRTRNITEEQRAVITQNMAALQAFTKAVRAELGEGVAYAEAKATAGARWKALSKEEKTAWASEHMASDSTSTGAVVGPAQAAAVPSQEKVIAVAAEEPKKGRGRPKKEAGGEVKVSKE